MTSAPRIDQSALRAALSPRWVDELPEASRGEARSLLCDLISDWAREADSDADPAAVNAIQRAELDDEGRDQPPAARLPLLRVLVLERRISRLRVRTFALGRAIIDGAVPAERARDEGHALLKEAESLGERVQAITDPAAVTRLRTPLGDALLEALFAVEGKAMSPRLSRYQQDRRAAPH